ncbi:MAG: nucleotidyltransferase family protein [Chloroflexi bacterium]|nr:nucleotidyltransferase family protein [Chloroflexota bacterium]
MTWRSGAEAVKLSEVPVAILAGGRATRLGLLAADLPKSMIPVAGHPFVDHQLALLQRSGVRRVVFCVGHLGDQIEAHVGDGARYGLEVRYAYDGERLLGTGGAVRRALPLIGPLCLVIYGDSYLDIDYAVVLEHFLRCPEPALMTVFRNGRQWDTSNVHFRDGRIVRYDKRQPDPEMAYIDYGASLYRAEALERIPLGEPYDLGDLTHELAAEGLLAGYEVTQRFYEVGSFHGIRETECYLLRSVREYVPD